MFLTVIFIHWFFDPLSFFLFSEMFHQTPFNWRKPVTESSIVLVRLAQLKLKMMIGIRGLQIKVDGIKVIRSKRE